MRQDSNYLDSALNFRKRLDLICWVESNYNFHNITLRKGQFLEWSLIRKTSPWHPKWNESRPKGKMFLLTCSLCVSCTWLSFLSQLIWTKLLAQSMPTFYLQLYLSNHRSCYCYFYHQYLCCLSALLELESLSKKYVFISSCCCCYFL
jgi:hypothetical protein